MLIFALWQRLKKETFLKGTYATQYQREALHFSSPTTVLLHVPASCVPTLHPYFISTFNSS